MYHLHLYSLISPLLLSCFFFFFNDTATTEIYTLSLHDALPISRRHAERSGVGGADRGADRGDLVLRLEGDHAVRLEVRQGVEQRSEEHTSELQSRPHLVCRLLLEKKKKTHKK